MGATSTQSRQASTKTVWQIDPAHSSASFVVRHMFTRVRGRFTQLSGTIATDDDSFTNGQVAVTIQADSVDTNDPQRDGHLRTNDFFGADENPTITFTSTEVTRDGSDWSITGDLTIKDVTKAVTIEFEQTGSARDPFGNLRVGFEGETTVNRKDWGLTWNAALETGGVLVSEKIKLEFDVSAIQNA